MMITGFYVSRSNFRQTNTLKALIRFCGASFVAVNAFPSATHAMASTGVIGNIAVGTFGPGGPGVLIISLLLIALVGWLAGYIAQAAGKGQIAGMIHVVTVFSCIGMVAEAALKALGTLAKLLS